MSTATTTLLDEVLAAHGGLERWGSTIGLTVEASIGGPFWGAKGHPDLLGEGLTIDVDLVGQQLTLAPFAPGDQRLVFDAVTGGVEIHDGAGAVVDALPDPRPSFAGYDRTTTWSATQTGHFIGYAMWNYLTTPLLFTRPGVEVREIEPRVEEDGPRRRLAVHFPPEIVTHNPDQIFHFDDELHLRRLDYAPIVNGDAAIAHLTDDSVVFDGLLFPTRRRIHRRLPDDSADRSFAAITIDITGVVRR